MYKIYTDVRVRKLYKTRGLVPRNISTTNCETVSRANGEARVEED